MSNNANALISTFDDWTADEQSLFKNTGWSSVDLQNYEFILKLREIHNYQLIDTKIKELSLTISRQTQVMLDQKNEVIKYTSEMSHNSEVTQKHSKRVLLLTIVIAASAVVQAVIGIFNLKFK